MSLNDLLILVVIISYANDSILTEKKNCKIFVLNFCIQNKVKLLKAMLSHAIIILFVFCYILIN